MSSLAVIIAGAVAAVVMLLLAVPFSLVTNYLYGVQPDIWKLMNELTYIGMLLFYLLSGLVYALVYSVLGKSIKGGPLAKGTLYGSLLWFVGPLPGLLMTHITMVVDPALIVVWLLQDLFNVLFSGIITAYVFEIFDGRKDNGSKDLRNGRKRARKA